jgi:NAD(P)-dependent dehydrogenase (short-subunit alcohol dehydrogenase family)
MRFSGKVVLVTGASRGIGRAIAAGFADEGGTVAVNYVQDEQSAQSLVDAVLAKGGRAIAVQADVSSRRDVERMVQTVLDAWGGIHVLVNNAGVVIKEDLFDVSESSWEAQFGVNCRGMFLVSQAVARWMKDHGGGRIVNVTSISGLVASPQGVVYSSTKGASTALSKAMAIALAPYNITVNAIRPGTVRTDFNDDVFAVPGVEERVIARIPRGRVGVPDDIAGAALFLASDQADWITGSTLVIDGGFTVLGTS